MGRSRPYSIITPDFSITSGGIRVMYALHGWLLAKGQISFVNGMMGDDFVAVYPEIYRDNPAGAPRVVRYLLNVPGIMNNPEPLIVEQDEKVYTFSQLYNVPSYKVDDDHIMFLPCLNLNLFKVTNTGKRTKRCKLIGKGTDLHFKETEDLTELTREFSNNQAALADYLNECEVMYSYDNNSAMFEIARLCGCRVVIIPSIYTKKEFSRYEPGLNGISYGLEEHVALDISGFRLHYQHMVKVFEERLDYFIEETQT